MSQDASIRQVLLNPLSDTTSLYSAEAAFGADGSTPAGKLPVESYADRLMDELFDDVEQMLGGNIKPQSEPVRHEPTPPTPVSSAPSSPTPSSSEALIGAPLAPRPSVDDDFQPSPHMSEMDIAPMATTTLAKPGRQSGRSYDRLLLAVGCISMMATLALWLLYQESNHSTAVIRPTSQTVTPITTSSDMAFAKYIGQSLKAIEQKSQTAGTSVALTNVPSGTTIPTVNIPGTTPGTLNTGSPTSPTGTSGVNPSRKLPGLTSVYVPPVYQLPQVKPSKGTTPLLKIPAIAPLPNASNSAAKPSVPLSSGIVTKTLVGVVEMGEESAILVEVNGVAQRFRLGESIGSTGWTLVEVSKNQAIMRRNGEVRSVFIGQSF